MSTMRDDADLPGRRPPPAARRELDGSELLVLDDPAAVWLVERGRVGLFAVVLGAEGSEGPRRFCFEAGPGERLPGFPPAAEGQPSVVAVGLEPATLCRLDHKQAPGAEAPAAWRRRWEETTGPLEIPGDCDLTALQEGILRGLAEQERTGGARASRRVAAQQRQARQEAEQAVNELAAVLDPRRDVLPRGSALFVAAAAVGQATGVTLREPATWEQRLAAADPVELIARASHVRAREVLLEGEWWHEDCGPLLGFLSAGDGDGDGAGADDARPVALLPRSTRRYELFDPAAGTRQTVDARIARRLTSRAYLFYRPLPEGASRGLGLLRFALRGRGRDVGTILATAAAATVLGMLTPQATALLVDHAIPDADYALLWQLGAGLLAAALGAAVFRLAQGIAMMRVETGADVATQSAVWDRLLNLKLSFFRDYSTGDLQSRVSAVSQIRSRLGGTTMRSLFSSVVLTLNLGLLLYYSPLLTLLALVVALLTAAVTIVSGAMLLRLSRQIWELRGRFFGFMVQLINGVAKLRVAAAEERAFARWARQYARLLRLELGQRRIQDAVQVANIAIATLSTLGLFAGAAALMRPGAGGTASLSTGVFLAFSVAYGTFIGAIATLSNTVTDVMAVAILRERARPILDATPEVDQRKTGPGELRGRMRLDHVSFQYREDGPTILDEVDLTIEPGQFVALVGPSGSGKSTLFRLLLGFETPQSGSILYDGQDLAGLDVHAVRRQMGVVLQNGKITAGSLFENIASATRITLNQAWQAARDAGFAEDVEAMPMGMHTVISEGGTNLSGGQRQRLLIARALVHQPRILLLDEATSALDNRTQAVVGESLRRLAVTRVVIAHRLSTVREADRIFVIESGRIVQAGRFEELAAQDGLFARLMARQMA